MIGDVVAVGAFARGLEIGRRVAMAYAQIVQIRDDVARAAEGEILVELEPVSRRGNGGRLVHWGESRTRTSGFLKSTRCVSGSKLSASAPPNRLSLLERTRRHLRPPGSLQIHSSQRAPPPPPSGSKSTSQSPSGAWKRSAPAPKESSSSRHVSRDSGRKTACVFRRRRKARYRSNTSRFSNFLSSVQSSFESRKVFSACGSGISARISLSWNAENSLNSFRLPFVTSAPSFSL